MSGRDRSRRKRPQLELDLQGRGARLNAAPAVAARRSAPELELGFSRLQRLYEIGKLLLQASGAPALEELLDRSARVVPLRTAVFVEAPGTSQARATPRITVARSPAADDAEVEHALAQARGAAQPVLGLQAAELVAAPALRLATPLPLPQRLREEPPPSRARFAALPLRWSVGPAGLLHLQGAQPFTRSDLAFLGAVADALAAASERAEAWEREVAARRRAEELDRAQKELVAIVSHDLRNPLGAVLLGVSSLRRRPGLEPGAVQEHLEHIHRAAQRAATLVHDLLDLSRLDAGLTPLIRAPVELPSLTAEAVEMMRPFCELRRISLVCDVAEGLPAVSADRERLLQVLANLLGNALKFSPEGSHIALRATPGENEVLLCVEDHGPGIAAEHLPRVFDRFFQGDSGRRAGQGGAGLGLAIAKGIVLAHGGRIWAESTQGQGARFTFSLPLLTP